MFLLIASVESRPFTLERLSTSISVLLRLAVSLVLFSLCLRTMVQLLVNGIILFTDSMVIYLFRLFLYRLFKSTTTQSLSRHSKNTVSEFHAEAPQSIASEGLAQGPYVATRVGFEPMTLGTKGVKFTNEPPRLKILIHFHITGILQYYVSTLKSFPIILSYTQVLLHYIRKPAAAHALVILM